MTFATTVLKSGPSLIIWGDKIVIDFRAIICYAGPGMGLSEADVRVCTLYAGGEMLLLLTHVNNENIRLLGMCQINTILHYPHNTTKSFTQRLAMRMV